MIDLADVRAFARIAELLSISGAARALDAPKSSVSRSLSRLEAAVGSVLVERLPRRLRLTDAGRLFLPHASRILEEVDSAEAVLGQFAGVPRGVLRVSAPYAFTLGTLVPMLPAFLRSYPEVAVVLERDTDWSGVSTDEADLFIRIGPLPDTAMVARRLATVELWTCASPGYVAARGLPGCPAALSAHDIVALAGSEASWPFRDAQGRIEEVALRPRAVMPDMALIHAALAAGAGVGQLPDYMAAAAIDAGELVRLLPDAGPASSDAFALYPSHRGLPTKARVFLDALVADIPLRRAAFNRSRG